MPSIDVSTHTCIHCQRPGTLHATTSGVAKTTYVVYVLEASCRECGKTSILFRS